MTSIARLKDKARKYEQKEDWRAAIQVYRQVLEAQEASDDLDLDLGLFNRIGDLNLRIGETDQAVLFYERAADAYAEFGFINNAIALCNKAIRHRPDRSELYLKLSRLYSRQGFQTDARRWILEYAEREVAAGRAEAALKGLEEFADLSADPEIRELLAQQLASHGRKAEAIKQLRTAYAMRVAAGQEDKAAELASRARAIDPSVDLGDQVSSVPGLMVEDPSEREDADDTDLEDRIVTTGRVRTPDELEADAATVEGLETGYGAEDDEAAEAGNEVEPAAPGEEPDERTGPAPLPLLDDEEEDPEETEEAEPLPTLETGYEKLAGEKAAVDASGASEPASVEEPAANEAGSEVEAVEGEAEAVKAVEPDVEKVARAEVEDAAEVEEVAEVDAADGEPVEAAREEAAESEVEEPEPVGPAGAEDEAPMHLSFEGGDAEAHGGVMGGPEEKDADVEVPDFAMDVDMGSLAAGLGAEDPTTDTLDVDAILNRSRELVSRGLTGEALYELHLLSGSDVGPETFEDALAVVNEILRRDENDITALERRVEYAARLGEDELLVDAYLDLADALSRVGQQTQAQIMYARALHLDPGNEAAREALGDAADEGGADANAVTEERETDGATGALADEALAEGGRQSDSEFSAMLDQFRAKVTENVTPEDAGDHYDLGLAFKEMGLIDEAIAEFQVALTGGEQRLKVYEELGQCFVLKGRYSVAVRVFERALKVPATEPAERLGVYYHLGQCYEELGQRDAARAAYEEVLSIDASFEDVPDRMARL